ncbi:TPA: hypothetical protein I7730_00055 [Vibrio vulnificus]|uniref:Uncharacterized protein n=1 Tax=Vibrio vulnificus TaxID=672 RepID=A0A8H9K4Y2_VIBVL|nr:hypothetical protein [Vibrio vulnificus]HAS8538190.1 hypothetical protein [Vibrio vulnificus]
MIDAFNIIDQKIVFAQSRLEAVKIAMRKVLCLGETSEQNEPDKDGINFNPSREEMWSKIRRHYHDRGAFLCPVARCHKTDNLLKMVNGFGNNYLNTYIRENKDKFNDPDLFTFSTRLCIANEMSEGIYQVLIADYDNMPWLFFCLNECDVNEYGIEVGLIKRAAKMEAFSNRVVTETEIIGLTSSYSPLIRSAVAHHGLKFFDSIERDRFNEKLDGIRVD